MPGPNCHPGLWLVRAQVLDHPPLFTYSMVQSPSREASWFAASQEIPRISQNPKVHYRTHKRPPQTTLPTVLISGPVIYISLDSLRSTCVSSDLQQTPTRSRLSPLGYRHFTKIYSTPGYKLWRHGGYKCQWRHRGGLMCTICYTSKSK